ncbi:Acriflavin resistance protein D [Candidatus Terasakiella magnetica]|uniref:Acriflavin resistance protein D n=1 Tax=Candidatus Terasakiella magnetica TaxID=1867952 RepID=A0A1C3RKD2_9PROT|nr:efflux RND transporter permease subunit [Candidatus Terasakiella magnetica]SCA57679.1 Acriflavin resistance protein D [Candidatus Terasakiella magnetica]
MNLIHTSIYRPIAVIAAVLMTILFGLVALQTIPIQLTPDVRKPVITVRTNWPGAAPAEIEREVVNRQEEVLRGLEGLDEMTSRSEHGRARITLEFSVGQNMDKALLLVANRLDRVSGYPEEADEPTFDTSGSEDNPIAWFVLQRLDGNERPIHTYGDFAKDVIKDKIERVNGIAMVNVYGGSERELVVTVDPVRLSQFQLTVPQVVSALRNANASISAGDVEEGKRRYVVRTEGELTSPDQVANVVVRSMQDAASGRVARVRISDIGNVEFAYKEPGARIRQLGQPAIAMNAQRDTGANVIETMAGLKAAIAELNEFELPAAQLKLTQVYDETLYINSAIELVQQNIYIGGFLAALVLLVFLRSTRATVIISLAIPVSVIGSFVAMAAMGRSINVISLAGIAFAVGMVVDAAIVVLENIYRLRQEGKSRSEAAYEGAAQVWSAVLVSALTTVLVFLPLLIMNLEIGQLFRDIAVAISVAVLLSLVVAITVIPALSNRILKEKYSKDDDDIKIPALDNFAKKFVQKVLDYTDLVTQSRMRSLIIVGAVSVSALISSWAFLPKMEYLPEGNRNLVFGILLPPPGYNLETTTGIANRVENAVRHLWSSETGPEAEEGQPPKIKNFFFVARNATTFVGAASEDASRASELIPVLRRPVFSEPGTYGFVTQPSLFGRSIGSGRSIDLNVSGPDLEKVLEVALRATGKITQLLPRKEGNQFRPKPGLELGAPEVRVYPDPLKLADNGVTARDLGQTVDAFNDGMRVAEITVDGKRIDLTLKGPDKKVTQTQGIGYLPVVTQSGDIVSVNSLADVKVTSGPTEIRHIERQRTVTLEVRPSPNMPLESAMDILRDQVMKPLQNEGIPSNVSLHMSGTADKLTQAWEAMVWEMLLAIAIVYLTMAVLFESFVYPFVIMLSVPLATAGGIAGLGLLNLFTPQPLDMLTLLGFVILVGIVVNNAILLVHQSLYHVREERLSPAASIRLATQSRIRPIFMSTLTSVFGMLPLVLFPGAGSELYRGLGSVVVGGLTLSALLTLVIIPPLLTIVLPKKS